jgi:hypothetical protein
MVREGPSNRMRMAAFDSILIHGTGDFSFID